MKRQVTAALLAAGAALAGGVNRIPAATVFLDVSGGRKWAICGALRVPGQGGGG